jgi:hypothetical protein
MSTHPNPGSGEQASHAIIPVRPATGPKTAPAIGTQASLGSPTTQKGRKLMNRMGRLRPHVAAIAAVLTGSAVFALAGPGQIASAQVAQPVATQDVPGVTVKYFYTNAVGGTDPTQNCMRGKTLLGGVVGSIWITSLCRVPDPAAGSGYYDYYNYAAGPGAWFMAVGGSGGYTYYADRLNVDAGYNVWYRYPWSNPADRQISVNGGSFESMGNFFLSHRLGFTLAVTTNDSFDHGIEQYVLGLVYQEATQHPWVAQSATQHLSYTHTVASGNAQFYQGLNQLNDGEIRHMDVQGQLDQQERLETEMSADQAAQQAAMDVPIN